MPDVAKDPRKVPEGVTSNARGATSQTKLSARPRRSPLSLPDPLLRGSDPDHPATKGLVFARPTGVYQTRLAPSPKLRPPSTAAQTTSGEHASDPAERQADAIGAAIGRDLVGVGVVHSGVIPESVRGAGEKHLGVDLSGTQLHGDGDAARHAKGLDALAVTEGSRISFGEGELATDTEAGRDLLGHELTHVAQQRTFRTSAAQRQVNGQSSTTPAGTPATAMVDAEAKRKLLLATTTLSKIKPLGEEQTRTLDTAIAGAPIVGFIKERDEKRKKLSEEKAELERMLDLQAHPPEHGAPPDDFMVQQVSNRCANLSQDIKFLEETIDIALTEMGISEEELVDYVKVRFPRLFVERSKEIAKAQLAANRQIVEEEAERYGIAMSVDPSARNALRAAAQDLLADQAPMRSLEREAQVAQSAADLPPGGIPEGGQVNSSYHDLQAKRARLTEMQLAYQKKLARYSLQFPILHDPKIDLAAVASSDEDKFQEDVGTRFQTLFKNIDDTEGNIEQERLKVWDLPPILELTKLNLGVEGNATLLAAIDDLRSTQKAKEEDLNAALTALGITAGIVATIATFGGATVVAGVAGAVGLGVGGFQASEGVKNFLAGSAASDVSLVPELGQLTEGEPDLGWLVLDLVGLGLDAIGVISAFTKLRGVVRGVLATGDLIDAVPEIRRVLPRGAERVLRSLGARGGGKAATVRILAAIRAKAFAARDLAAIEARLKALSDRAIQEIFADLRGKGGVRPLTREALIDVLGKKRGAREAADIADTVGIYFDDVQVIFVEPGALDEVASTLVHEATHHLQNIKRFAQDDFVAEVQAFAMERRYLRRLVQEPGGIDLVPEDSRWLLGATDEDIADEVADLYPELTPPTTFDAKKAIREVLGRVRRFR